MPPKQQSKADLAKKQKVVEDKTFGLKNKNKSKNVQKYVQSLKQSVQPKADPSKLNAQKKKEEEKAREKELQELFKVAVKQPKVPVGVDPKSIVCEHFKVGQCAKGFKCKFSHDLNVQRKGEKIDIYSDKRDQEQETMEDWDQETLEKVVASKSDEYNKNKPTDIVRHISSAGYVIKLSPGFGHCKVMICLVGALFKKQNEIEEMRKFEVHYPEFRADVAATVNVRKVISISGEGKVCKYFLEAVEKKQYGWFWVCPNGGKECHYRHALPPGYVLKSQMKALLEEESEKISIEEEIENQRAKVTTTTPMTPELFMQWRKKKMEEREAGLAAQRAERAKNDRMRQLFLSDASLFVDDAEAYDKYQREEEPDVDQKNDTTNQRARWQRVNGYGLDSKSQHIFDSGWCLCFETFDGERTFYAQWQWWYFYSKVFYDSQLCKMGYCPLLLDLGGSFIRFDLSVLLIGSISSDNGYSERFGFQLTYLSGEKFENKVFFPCFLKLDQALSQSIEYLSPIYEVTKAKMS
ncbi:zinc finger CCCH domain-containing protein 21 [Striga asiatica]|uniref:Zinc finger CCCH domain-containing protein 21 n=1 Tax=Striga asiatica TaxID=4170 RepID=A0A5A7QGB1_STRAF|nr:zinc finger CCCH domain-containing protein 21 [Striga asiatica]